MEAVAESAAAKASGHRKHPWNDGIAKSRLRRTDFSFLFTRTQTAEAGVSAIAPVPDLSLSANQKLSVNQARRLPVWFKRGDLVRKANIDVKWMSALDRVQLWRTPYSSAKSKGGPFLGATWAFIRLAEVSRMQMTENESLRALQDVRQLERLLLTSESHILNLQALQVMGIEQDFVARHRRLFSYLNRWTVPPADFAVQYREASNWLPHIWNWGMSADLIHQIETASRSNPLFCSAMERGMSEALNFRPLLSSKDPDFFQRQMRWGSEWSSICHRPEFAKAWNNPRYVPRGVQDWYAIWNGHPSHWLKVKHVMWWKSARVLIGGQVWLDKLIEFAGGGTADEADEN